MHPFSFEQIAADMAESFFGSFGANVEALLATMGSQVGGAVHQPLLLVAMVGFLAACARIRHSWSCKRQRGNIR